MDTAFNTCVYTTSSNEMMSYLSHANLTMVTSSWKIVDFMSGKVQSCLGIRGEHSRQNWPIVITKLKLKSVVLVYVFLLVSAICFRFIRSIQSCCILLHLISHFDSAFWKCNQLWHSAASLCICHILWLGLKIIKLFPFISMESPKQDLGSGQDYFVGANSLALIYKSGLVWVCFETKMVQWQKVG